MRGVDGSGIPPAKPRGAGRRGARRWRLFPPAFLLELHSPRPRAPTPAPVVGLSQGSGL